MCGDICSIRNNLFAVEPVDTWTDKNSVHDVHAQSRCTQDSAKRGLLRIGRNVPSELTAILAAAFLVLNLVCDLDLGEVQTDVLGQSLFAVTAARRDRRHQQLVELKRQILERLIT